ncbi:hypothetical protein M885DRAFT_501109 [Pelagophyceae sp. CCMP2097]|nr:hypothetical protein M885DRAFT_501109 [Pelagophyceae sp. CCMP2097]
MSAKRGNPHAQQRREEAEDAEDGEGEAAGSWSKASAEVISQRRIVKVSGGSARKAAANPFANVSLPSAATSANPFGGFGAAPAAAPSGFGGAASFGAASSFGGAAASSFGGAAASSFGGAAASTFGGAAASSFGGAAAPAAAKDAPAKTSTSTKVARCNAAFLQWLQRQTQSAPNAPWTQGIQDYLDYVEPLLESEDTKAAEPEKAPAAKAAAAPASAFGSAPAGGAFGFPAAAAPAPAAPFSFAAAPAASASPFSFAAPPAPAPFAFGGAVPAASGGAVPADDEDAMPLEAREAVARGDDGDEVVKFESRCGMKRYDKGEAGSAPQWRDIGKGLLRVMQHKTTGARRVVCRNDVGKVVLNFSLAATMKVQKTKAGFAVTAMSHDGPQQYLLRTKDPIDAGTLAPAQYLQER